MAAPLTTQLRLELTDKLRAAGLECYPQVMATLSPPCVVLVPDSPYLEVNRVGQRLAYLVRLRLAVMAQALDGTAGLEAVELLLDAVLRALPSGINVERVDPPTLDTLGAQGSIYVSEVTITTQVKETP